MFNGNSFVGSKLCAYDRSAMMSGAAATQQCFQLSSGFGGVLPSDLDGTTRPPTGSPNFLLNFGANSLNLWKFHVDFATPANTTLLRPLRLTEQPAKFQIESKGMGGTTTVSDGAWIWTYNVFLKQ